jgi:hypothetical protein
VSVALPMHPREGGPQASASVVERPCSARSVTISEVKALGFPSQRAKAERHRLSPTETTGFPEPTFSLALRPHAVRRGRSSIAPRWCPA